MVTQRQSAVRPAHPTVVESCQSSRPIAPSRQNSVLVPVVVEDHDILSPDDEEAKIELTREAERQTLFQKISNDVLKTPNGYRKVEVLIIRWHESIDEFKDHKQEIERLKTIFTAGFGYGCTVKSICNSSSPQVDLNHHVLSHVREHDGDDNLLIVYYTGHGFQVKDEQGSRLQLSASRNWNDSSGRSHPPTAFWDEAEAPLKTHALGDALAILDCCFASTAAVTSKGRNQELRTYQMLAASSADEFTFGPGEKSFTHALCDSLEELLREASGSTFPVIKLWERINTKRTTQAALIWDRLQRYKRHVELGRLDPNPKRDASFRNEEPEQACLVVRFSLKTNELNNQQVDTLARQLPAAFKEAGVAVRRMEYVEFERRNDPTKGVRRAVRIVHQAWTRRKSKPSGLLVSPPQYESRKRRRSNISLLSPTGETTRESSYGSEEVADSGLCTPPRRSPRFMRMQAGSD
ncbi:hypothetical protein BDW02DRAFT_633411 [Decorospora gaudefroyi]|uniref:Peptidase C14 caspase domain-containing protein n=1 Tax=Decorospora gaudefroyi TaxID=184978 RepID=A0A6A5JZQ1_9PLEO|nr:hypothetical protein BDW02DRAFT_633411 [Decorospora gaudefroyi]